MRADKKTILKIEKLKVLKDEPKSKAITRNIFEALQIQTILNIFDEGRFHVPFVGNFLTGKVDNEVVFVDFESDPVFPRLAADPTKVSNYIRLRIMDEITSILTT